HGRPGRGPRGLRPRGHAEGGEDRRRRHRDRVPALHVRGTPTLTRAPGRATLTSTLRSFSLRPAVPSKVSRYWAESSPAKESRVLEAPIDESSTSRRPPVTPPRRPRT